MARRRHSPCVLLTLFEIIFISLLFQNRIVDSFGEHIFDTKKIQCGILYSGKNFTFDKLEIPNPKVIGDLSSIRITEFNNVSSSSRSVVDFIGPDESLGLDAPPLTWDKRISSFNLFDGCKMKSCVGTHLDGHCEWFNESRPVLENEWDKQISSLGCSCPIENCEKSTCSKVKIRGKDCGRAFLEPNCQICDGAFITIKKNHSQSHFGKYENTVKSLIINPGCTFTYYTERDFDGSEDELFAGFYEVFESTLGSYECLCDEMPLDTESGTSTPTPNPDDPPLKDFVMSDEGIQEMARAFPKHAGLDAALTSIRHGRSSMNAYILLIGLTGSGKSSTINFLFENNITTVGSLASTTDSINEYRIPIRVDELGCKNCELRVIDTPGIGDTSGLEVDAKFLAGLETFLNNHEELRYRIPNIVLVFSKFSDNRISGKSSTFVKTLRGIEYFSDRLFDTKYSNVITVLTHFMSENAKIRKNPAVKTREFRHIIEDYTMFPKPITTVVAENRPEEQELVLVNGYYLLPNKEYYPQNLFEKIQEATIKGKDPIGEAIIRTAFKSPENFKITEHPFFLRNVSFIREPFFLAELNRRNFNIDLTEVSNITESIYESGAISSDLKRKFPGALQYVQRMLNLQGIHTKADIPRTTIGILKLFKHIRQNELVLEILSKAFDLEIPKLEIPLVVGHCYNVLKDTLLPETPFNVTASQISDLGFMLPNTLSVSLTNEVINFFNLQDTKADYSKVRLSHLKVDGSKIKPELNYWEVRPGYNILEDFSNKVTVLREYRDFQLTLNDKIPLKSDFITRVKTIEPFDEKNHTIVSDWKQFFATYGTHVVSSTYGGGAILAEFKVKNTTISSEEARKLIKNSIEEFFNFLEDIYLGKRMTSNDIDTTHVQYSLRFIGGDFKYSVDRFTNLTISETSSLLDGFGESLQYQPAILQTSMNLIPLHVIVKKYLIDGAGAADKISNATIMLLNSTLDYVPPPPQPPPLERPEVKKHIEEMKARLTESIDRLNTELVTSRSTFENYTRELVQEGERERAAMLIKLKNLHEEALKEEGYTCVYEQTNLREKKHCSSVKDGCVCIQMKTLRSVNTHNSCVQFFKGCGCSGTGFKHTSNITQNTKFPFDMSGGGRFSMANCSYVPPKKIEIVISFDTTGSMYSYLTTVRTVIKDMLKRLTTDIPDIRIGIIAHGDYSDKSTTYVTKSANNFKFCDGEQSKILIDFVTNVGSTFGGDGPECYELVLRQARQKFDWTTDSHKALFMIGDNLPHEASYSDNTDKINWREELRLLKAKGVRIHGIQAGTDSSAATFYREISSATKGSHLNLAELSTIPDLLIALVFLESDVGGVTSHKLRSFEGELTSSGRMVSSLRRSFDTILVHVS